MQGDEDVVKALVRFEQVEWLYDGLNGKIIPWTLENGNTNHDPSVLAFIVAADGAVVTRAPNATPYNASSFSKWLNDQAKAYERTHPRTLMPFIAAELTKVEEPTCRALTEARSADAKILLYFGREERADADKAARKQRAAALKLEKGALNHKDAAKHVEGWTLLRFDLSDEKHRTFAKSLGVETAPALLLWLPGMETPEKLRDRITGGALAYRLKKANEE